MDDEVNYGIVLDAFKSFAIEAKRIYEEVFLPIGNWFNENKDTIQAVGQLFLDARVALQAAERLGDKQYVLWQSIDRELAESIIQAEDIDDIMQGYYESNNGEQINTMLEHCREAEIIQPQSDLYSQIEWSYRNERYNLAAVGLMALLDGMMAVASGDIGTSLKKKLDLIMNKMSLEQMLSKEEVSILTFTKTIQATNNTMFAHSDFSQVAEPQEINRHWIVHGRTTRQYTKLDCIKMFSMLCGIILLDEMNKEEKN